MHMKARLYNSCVRKAVFLIVKQPVKDDHVKRLEPIEKCTVRWMCRAAVLDSKISEILRSRLGIESINKNKENRQSTLVLAM